MESENNLKRLRPLSFLLHPSVGLFAIRIQVPEFLLQQQKKQKPCHLPAMLRNARPPAMQSEADGRGGRVSEIRAKKL